MQLLVIFMRLCNKLNMKSALITIGCVLLVVLFGYASYRSEAEFQNFVVLHNCVITGRIDSRLTPGIGLSSDGNVVMTTNFEPDRTIYQCDTGTVIH